MVIFWRIIAAVMIVQLASDSIMVGIASWTVSDQGFGATWSAIGRLCWTAAIAAATWEGMKR